MIWNFTLYLKPCEITDDLAESLYGDFADGTLASCCGRFHVSFGREAPTLNRAIGSAVEDIRRHGLDVERVEIEEGDLAENEIAQWQTV
jgi:hypothetical protein